MKIKLFKSGIVKKTYQELYLFFKTRGNRRLTKYYEHKLKENEHKKYGNREDDSPNMNG